MDGSVKRKLADIMEESNTQTWIPNVYPEHDDESSNAQPTNDPHSDIFQQIKLPSFRKIRQIWAIGGGKGGVGKSLIASSLAICTARMGHKVTAVDLDLGGANLHTTLGMDLPKTSLSDYFSGRIQTLEGCLVPSGIQNLDVISGAQDAVGVANVSLAQKIRLIESLLALDTDYLVLDLGAGTTFNTIDFFLISDIGIITLLPEPTSIENAYRFIKSSYFRYLRHSPRLQEIRTLVDMAMDSKNPLGIRTPSDLFRETNRTSPEAGMRLKKEIEKFRPKLIVNQTRTQTDIDIGYSIKAVCKQYFGIEMDYIGYLDHDSAVWQSIRRKRPLTLEFPNSRLVSSLERVVQQITKNHANQRSDLLSLSGRSS